VNSGLVRVCLWSGIREKQETTTGKKEVAMSQIKLALFLIVLAGLILGPIIYMAMNQEPTEYMEGTVVDVKLGEVLETFFNHGGRDKFGSIKIWFEERDTSQVYPIAIYDYHSSSGGSDIRKVLTLTVNDLLDQIKEGTLLRLPIKEMGERYYTDEVQLITKFSEKKVVVAEEQHVSAVTPGQLPEYEVLTESGKVFALSLKDNKVKINGNKEDIQAHVEEFGPELGIVRDYIGEESVDKTTLLRRLKNAGFIKVVEYRQRSKGDLILQNDFLVVEE